MCYSRLLARYEVTPAVKRWEAEPGEYLCCINLDAADVMETRVQAILFYATEIQRLPPSSFREVAVHAVEKMKAHAVALEEAVSA
jgi:hypothetical protein